ncbi:sensor histidine kinase [Afifella marina]|uniref:histidine kinase n=1 Tax=Afifella marina DSM 2698 TaxID=1120955 RepID=A0A1G5NCK9_AFIMA|nr:sensor histidine kinase [Afifella marina]MBK1623298.1 histidine kinase [Afifella marina DSM 2698]MBK1626292.1 histidine kinase [Afifella marina]MBK5917170.1 histidine kinase [Afifella marina]RAI22145.1 histidine kinase [Afifella marina DSM 2698]SCZ35126.1 two-component system, OmpR family, sensor histidine kinase ChvG [Afifella marina DSM 2698]
MVAETHPGETHRRDETPRQNEPLRARRRWRRLLVLPFARGLSILAQASFSSVSRRIVTLNLAGLIALVLAVLYLNQFRAGLIDARVESLRTQGEIIAAAIAAQATVETDAITIDPDKLLELQAGESVSSFDVGETSADFPINPERVAPLLKRLMTPTRIRGRLYDQEGNLIVDSKGLYTRGQILRFDLPAPEETRSWWEKSWDKLRLWLRRGDLPKYHEVGAGDGRAYPEVVNALSGQAGSVVRVGEDGGLIVSVAVPVQRFRAVLGALLLSTESGDIDAIVHAERMGIFRVFLVAASSTVLLSILLASTIAGPISRLSQAAERVGRGVRSRMQIPDFGERKDEIGHLARSLRDMTNALYSRMDAIERFAADVAHELKNPLTSLRSAVETLPIARSEENRERLLAVIKHDVRRLDRLISDISDASRLDAELAREDTEPVDIARLLEAVVSVAREVRTTDPSQLTLSLKSGKFGKDAFYVLGHDSRLGQVFNNLIDNALSFSPDEGVVRVVAERVPGRIVVVVDDDGRGIPEDNFERIFERFYTDRPEKEAFGNNSGLGLAISRQIVVAHRGTITAENRRNPGGSIAGARFTVVLPAAD